jgi:hypothetical protein
MDRDHAAFRPEAPPNAHQITGYSGNASPENPCFSPQSPRGTQPPNRKLPGPRLMGFAFRFLLGQDVQGDLFTFGPCRMHLR